MVGATLDDIVNLSPHSSMRDFRRAVRGCVNRPVLYHARDGFGAALMPMFEGIARGERVSDSDIFGAMDRGAYSAARVGSSNAATAVLSLHGVATYQCELQPIAFSTARLAQNITALADDPAISAIILDIDSPGGMVTGTAEAGDAIYAAGKRKKVVALVNPLCASAAYWLASQASEIVAIKSADVGSIGVFMAHTDCSKFNEMQGLKVTYIYAGEYKVEGNSDEPLSDEAKAYYQSEVDSIYDAFLKAVARGRKTTVQDVFDNFGQGRTMSAKAALAAGMIDAVATPAEAIKIATSRSAARASRLARLAEDAAPLAPSSRQRRLDLLRA